MATSDKYDRQLRLWGANGQKALCDCHAILINATAAGTESLKNLVLPGIGSFHIVDDAFVPSYDDASSSPVFSNFFAPSVVAVDGLPPPPRAKVACELLSELNDDVRGSYEHVPSLKDVDFNSLLTKSDPDRKPLVIAADLGMEPLLRLSQTCFSKNISLISVKSYGLVGTVRIQTSDHLIIESKPDNSVPDLRLANFNPLFESLQSLVDETANLEDMDNMEHAHTPYVFILIKAMEKWRLSNSTEQRLPKTLEEKNAFREIVKSMSRNFNDELNFQEAYRDAYLAYSKRDMPYEVTQLLDQKILEYKTSFDVLLGALKRFLTQDGNGEPPLHGSIPDMTSATEPYIKLQEAYQIKAKQDRQQIRCHVDAILKENGSSLEISEQETDIFCKNVYNLQSLSTRSFQTEFNCQTSESLQMEDDVRDDLLACCYDPSDPPEQTPLLWWIALRACELFEHRYGAYPGTTNNCSLALEADVKQVHDILIKLLSCMKLSDCEFFSEHLIKNDNIVREMVRYGNAEVHNIGSVIGGVASQEAVKLITKQYFPVNNTYVFNGIASIAAVYQF